MTLVTALVISALLLMQSRKPLSNDELIQMKKAGLDDKTVERAIEANGVTLDTSVGALVALKNAGVSDEVIRAALSVSGQKATPPVATGDVPEELGAYVIRNGVVTALPSERPNMKSAGMFKSMMTAGLSKAQMKGTLPGRNSRVQTSSPVVLLIRCAEGTTIDDFQLLLMETAKDGREFVMARGGPFGTSTGVAALPVKAEKAGRNLYRVTSSEWQLGEYGILSFGGMGTAGKIYTFGVRDGEARGGGQ